MNIDNQLPPSLSVVSAATRAKPDTGLQLISGEIVSSQGSTRISTTGVAPIDTVEATNSQTEKALFYPCHALHDSLPYSPETIRLCARVAAKVSKMPLDVPPIVCVPTLTQFGDAIARDGHTCTSAAFDSSRPEGHAVFAQAWLVNGRAAYLFTRHQIVLHPSLMNLLATLGDDWSSRMILVHEMTHAAQAQKYPFLFEKIAKVRDQMITSVDAPIQSLGDLWRIRQASAKLEASIKPISILIEGHATWVERAIGDQVFPRAKSLPARLGYKFWSYLSPVDGPFRDGNAYALGLPLVSAVKKLQAELEAAPFRDSSNNLVELRPNLRGDGFLDFLFTNPELVNQLLPHQNAWLASSRERVNIDFLRQLIIRLPGHVRI